MIVTSGAIGIFVNQMSIRFFHYRIKSKIALLFAGIAGATWYAQTYSLFSKVSLLANVILLLMAGSIVVIYRKDWMERIRQWQETASKGTKVFVILSFLLFAYGTSRGILHYDTALYHAQSIHWVESYGVVKGLGNLHCRLGYNSAAFPLTALYSMHFISGQSFHVMSGFMAWLLCLEAGKIIRCVKRKKMLLSDYGRFMAFYYLFAVFDEMISPASDYFMVLTAFYIVIRYLSLAEEHEEDGIPYGLLCLLCVFLMTIKLSAACILLLVLYPAVKLIREKKYREIVVFLCVGFMLALPYFVRNYVISGWIVYPFTAISVGNPDWQIPVGMAEYDAREIQVYGRGYTDVLQYDMPIREWLPGWFAKQGGLDKLFILAGMLSVPVMLIEGLFTAVMACRGKLRDRARMESCTMLVKATCVISFLFWLFTSPLFRYGCVYVWLSGVLVLADLAEQLLIWMKGRKRKVFCALYYGAFLLFSLYKVTMFTKETVESYRNAYWILQKDYDNYETEEIVIEDEIFYIPITGDQTGYKDFPSAPAYPSITFRGETIGEGFSVK